MSEIDVSKCIHYKNKTCLHDYLTTDLEFDKAKCDNSPDCYYKQLQQLKAENEKLKSYLDKIREEELNSLDIEWDEYETGCRTTDYSNIVTLVEEALGEDNENR